MDLFPDTLGGRENGNRQESGGGSRGWDIRRSKLIGSTENRSQIGFCWISTKDCRIPKRSDTAHELRGNVWRTIRASSEAINHAKQCLEGVHAPYQRLLGGGFLSLDTVCPSATGMRPQPSCDASTLARVSMTRLANILRCNSNNFRRSYLTDSSNFIT